MFHENWGDLPESISVMYSHLGKRNEKNLLYLKSAGGSSAINLLGRFGVGNKKIEKIITQIAQSEQYLHSDKILASILHLPESRTGNILLRPIIRNYEIPYLSKSLLSDEQQILLEDLVVSIKQNRVVLRSKRLNKEIIPRLDNAHNYSFKALPVYHFLCDLQTQNLREGLYFNWGALQNEFSVLPRVEIENVIISLATWQLKKEQFKILLENDKPIKSACIWQEMWRIPDLILLADGDNELLINLKDELSLSMFVAEIKKREQIILKEFLFDEKTAFIKDKNGNAYNNEFITILQKQDLSTQTKKNLEHFVESNNTLHKTENLIQFVPRTFALGSEWLYYKIYCGVKTSDRILTNIIKPFTEQLIQEHLIDSWFFIRYADPDVHLRVRFHFSDTKNIGVVIEKFHTMIAYIQSTGLIWKVQTDTYQREIERYGMTSMVLSEQVFFYDSVCIVNLLDKIKGSKGDKIRWLFGIKAVNELFDNFNLNLEQKLTLTEHLKTNFASEFNTNKSLKKQLDRRYRENRKEIERLLTEDTFLDKEYQFIVELLKQKEKQLKPVIEEILNLQNHDQLHEPIPSLLSSYIHMLLNRLFRNKQRMHEMVIYDYMWRTYRSIIAQNKTSIRTNMNSQ
jgi:lantibiotic biosynthesis protein